MHPAIFITERAAFAAASRAVKPGQSIRLIAAKHYEPDKSLTLGFKVLLVDRRGASAHYIMEPAGHA